MDEFRIELLDQYWILGSRDPDGDPEDLTSHGKIALIINGQDISGCDHLDTDYGLNQSAVRLLQSIFLDQSSSVEHMNPIFYHGCSIICTCPNCVIDFRVQHLDQRVVLDQFFVSGGSESEPADRYKDIEVQLNNVQYAKTIADFSREVLDFLSPNKSISKSDSLDETAYLLWELKNYYLLRSELGTLLIFAKEYISTGILTDRMISHAENVNVSALG